MTESREAVTSRQDGDYPSAKAAIDVVEHDYLSGTPYWIWRTRDGRFFFTAHRTRLNRAW